MWVSVYVFVFVPECVYLRGHSSIIKARPRKIERSVFFLLDPTDKLEFTDWSEVQRRFGSGEIAIF